MNRIVAGKILLPLFCLFIAIVAPALPASAMQPPHRHKAQKEDAAIQERIEEGGAEEARPAEAGAESKPESLREALDRRYRFAKRGQSEISLFGGNYLGDEWHNTWDAGARYYMHINNTFAVGGAYTYSPIRTDQGTEFGRNLDSKQTHMMNGEMMIANDCALRAGKSIIECDLYLTLGVGAVQIDDDWHPVGIIGGGIKIYTMAPWFAVRFDFNNYLHPTPKPSGDSFNSDMAINIGFSFLFPVRKAEGEAKERVKVQ